MINKKPANKYTFVVEGKTEALYLEHLAVLINGVEDAECKCNIPKPQIGLLPQKARRNINTITNENYFFLADREKFHDIDKFKSLIKKLSPGRNERKIKFILGYCNVSLELWILLHKISFTTPIDRQQDYLKYINKAFGTSFESMDDYKNEKNFKKLLSFLTIEDVKVAIKRAKDIQGKNVASGFQMQQYCGVKYYNENPSLSIHEIIEGILNECLNNVKIKF